MPFREKSAWISFVVVLAVFAAFFAGVVSGRAPSQGWGMVHLLLMSVIAVVVLQAGLTLAAKLFARGDAGSPKDERERLIELKAARVALTVQTVAVLSGIFVALHGPLRVGPPELALVTLGALVVGDLAKSAAQIFYFRRGA